MNKIYIGNYNINKAYLGGDLTIKIYLGDNLVYPIEDAVAITFYDDSGNTATINCDDLGQSGRISYSDTESFQGTSYTSAVVGDCVNIIGGGSLPYQLTALTLSDSVTELEENGSIPQNCVTLVCGTGLTTVGGYCMEYRTSLQSVTFNGSTPPTFNNNWEEESNKTFTIYVPCDAIEAYRTALTGKTANLNDRLQCIPTVQNKWSLTFANGDVRSLECNASGDSFPHQIDNVDWSEHNSLSPFDATHAKSGVTSAVIGDCVAGIINAGMSGFINLSAVTVNPNTMYAYGGYSGWTNGCCAFAGDYSLVEFPYSSVLESIGRDSFHGCSGLTDATIASSCTYIGDEAFFDCTGLEKVVMEGSTPPALGGDFVFYKIDSNAPSGVSQLDIDIEVPCDAVNTYKTAPRWSAYADRITCQAPPHDYSQDYFTTESLEDGNTISFTMGTGMTTAITTAVTSVSVSTDDGVTWTSMENIGASASLSVTLDTGEKAIWKGEAIGYSITTGATKSTSFSSTGLYKVYGNILSLLYDDDFINQNNPTLSDFNCFTNLFYDSRDLMDASNLFMRFTLNSTTKRPIGYLFRGCTNLIAAPELGNIDFVGAPYAFRNMFHDCTSLTTAPSLTATTLSQGCYANMFQGCTSLTTAPELPATTLADSCYRQMFYNCSSLNYIKCLATDISASNSRVNWVNGVAIDGTFVKAASMNDWECGDSGIPNDWVVYDEYGNEEENPCSPDIPTDDDWDDQE